MGRLRQPTNDDGDKYTTGSQWVAFFLNRLQPQPFDHDPAIVAHLESKIVSLIFHHQAAHFQIYGLQQNPYKILLSNQNDLIHKYVFSGPESKTTV
ncbi:hypothetical protein AAC387_Pa04g2335 [Persea americana]